MRTRRLRQFGFCMLMAASLAQAQNDGDHLITNPLGQSSLATDAQLPGVNPVNMTIGTTPGLGATLRVRGDQLPVNDVFGGSRCTFRTDVPFNFSQNWSMVRNNVQQGRLYHGAEFNWFAVQAPQPHGDGLRPGMLFLENSDQDGIMIRANGLAVNPVNGYPLRTNGFISVGHRGLVPAVA